MSKANTHAPINWRKHQQGRVPVLLIPSDATEDDVGALANTTHRDNIPRTKMRILSAHLCKHFTAAMWRKLNFARYPALHSVDVGESSFGDEQLQLLTELRELTALNLLLCPVSDEGMSVISGLNGLTRLSLAYTKITDSGVRCLRGLRELTHLNLGYTRIGDTALECLTALPRLTELSVQSTKVTAAGVKPFIHSGIRVNADPLVMKG